MDSDAKNTWLNWVDTIEKPLMSILLWSNYGRRGIWSYDVLGAAAHQNGRGASAAAGTPQDPKLPTR